MGLNKKGDVNAPMEAPGDSCACCLFSFYVAQSCKHPARTGLPGSEEDGEGRMAGQGDAGCWQHPCRSSMGGLTPAPCWRCAPIAVLCFTHLKYLLSLHGGKEGLPPNLGQPCECAPRSKSQQCLCSTGPTGALLGSALNGR